MKAAQYEQEVIVEFANRLYKQASSVIRNTALLGAVIGFFAGAYGALMMQDQSLILGIGVVGSVLGSYLGYARGKEKAFQLKLEAQVALCQAQIEKNTRKS